jgi:hypothetical protein
VAARPSDQVDRPVADGDGRAVPDGRAAPDGRARPGGGAAPRPGSIRHPLNPNAYYADNGDGTVHVTMGTRWGRFTPNGRYVEGTLFEADPELCVWVSAPRPSSHHRISRVLDMPSER